MPSSRRLSIGNNGDDTSPAALAAPPSSLRRLLIRRPLDAAGIVTAAAASLQVVINALFLQSGPHPAPMFAVLPRSGDPTGSVTAVAPRPRPADLGAARPESAGARTGADIVSDLQRELERRGFYDGPIDGLHGPKTDGAVRDFATAAGLKWNGEMNDEWLRAVLRSPVKAAAHAAPVVRNDAIGELLATSSRRMLAVQRALGDFGYGPVKPTGSFGPDTKAAIEKFERDRRMPVTGQVSERLLRELAAVTGRPLD